MSEFSEQDNQFKAFETALEESGLYPLTATGIEIFQPNFGKLCNQACKHCHVGAGPDRKEKISRKTLEDCLFILKESRIPVVDITGGAPELNEHFRWFVQEVKQLNRHVMVRHNLTVMFEPGQEDLPEFFKDNEVELICSLPYYLERSVDRQRGTGVFNKSMQALKRLNALGYGMEENGLQLNLVYNPGGAFLPPSQSAIEADFKRELDHRYQIRFNHLFTIANMPIGRFRDLLEKIDNYDCYMNRLIAAYNPEAAKAVMCRDTLSIGWDGRLYDCDFNQMLGMNCNHGAPSRLSEFDLKTLNSRQIVTGLHCYGCTAGVGSSCGGAVVEE
ncbi:arsenosugar biosynthesis radical SAM protein ArsS [candidate division KSB1 bacterium]|nr:arsenosugar biosynthesis radical SAM protein ArsS [candidate division KSB1 bacterium]